MPAIHRVVYPEETGVTRMSMWYEVCTTSQEGVQKKKQKKMA